MIISVCGHVHDIITVCSCAWWCMLITLFVWIVFEHSLGTSNYWKSVSGGRGDEDSASVSRLDWIKWFGKGESENHRQHVETGVCVCVCVCCDKWSLLFKMSVDWGSLVCRQILPADVSWLSFCQTTNIKVRSYGVLLVCLDYLCLTTDRHAG